MLKVPVYFDTEETDNSLIGRKEYELEDLQIFDIYVNDVLDILPNLHPETKQVRKGCKFVSGSKELYMSPLSPEELDILIENYYEGFYPEGNINNRTKNNDNNGQTI